MNIIKLHNTARNLSFRFWNMPIDWNKDMPKNQRWLLKDVLTNKLLTQAVRAKSNNPANQA